MSQEEWACSCGWHGTETLTINNGEDACPECKNDVWKVLYSICEQSTKNFGADEVQTEDVFLKKEELRLWE